jgi:hypothetical protein
MEAFRKDFFIYVTNNMKKLVFKIVDSFAPHVCILGLRKVLSVKPYKLLISYLLIFSWDVLLFSQVSIDLH